MHTKSLWQLNDLIFFIPGAKNILNLILAPEVSLNSKPHVLASILDIFDVNWLILKNFTAILVCPI